METESIAICTICFDNLCQAPNTPVNVNFTAAAAGAEPSSTTCALLECGHVFHKFCVNRWFETSAVKKCPYCQKIFSPTPKVGLIHVLFKTSLTFRDMMHDHISNEMDAVIMKTDINVMKEECGELRTRITTLKDELTPQPTHISAANVVQESALDLRMTRPSQSIRRSPTSLNQISRLFTRILFAFVAKIGRQ